MHLSIFSPTEKYLWPKNYASECPSGTGVPQDRCEMAGRALELGDRGAQHNNGALSVNSWAYSPCGCSLLEDTAMDRYTNIFDLGNNGCSTHDHSSQPNYNFQVLCTVPPPSDDYTSIHLWPKNARKKCQDGYEVTLSRCYATLRALVRDDTIVTTGNKLLVGTWGVTPCGCFIWNHVDNNLHLDYDTKTDNCGTGGLAQIACKAPPPCFLKQTCS